jgi:hypothetical protein
MSEYFFIGIGGNTNLPFKRVNDIIAFGLIDRFPRLAKYL